MERGGRLPGGTLPAAHGPAGHRKDVPGPDDCGEAARAGQGGAPGRPLLRAEPGPGGADGRPLGAQVRARGQRANWLVVEEITQLDMADLACVGLSSWETSAVAGRARLLGRAAHQRAVGAQPAHPRPGRGTGTSSRRTCAPTPASSTS